MATEGSVAPKERVNITYKPSLDFMAFNSSIRSSSISSLPAISHIFLLVVGDFTGREDDRPVEDRAPINIDKDNFGDVLKAQKLSLDLSVPNKLAGEDSTDNMAVNLKIESLADFEPDAIVEKVPELKSILELRDALKALKGPLGNIPDFRKKLQELVNDEGIRAKLLGELGLDKK
jgi:type VI secretion system protein ImpB